MGATLDIRFVGPNADIYNAPPPPFSRFATFTPGNLIRDGLESAFDRSVNRFDYTTGQYAINVDVRSSNTGAGAALSADDLRGDTYVQVGASGGTAILMPLFGLNVAGRNGTTPAMPALTLSIPAQNVSPTPGAPTIPTLGAFEHALGVRSARGTTAESIPAGGHTVYDGNVVDATLPGGAPQFSFAGPNTLAFFGKPVPLSPLDVRQRERHLCRHGGGSNSPAV